MAIKNQQPFGIYYIFNKINWKIYIGSTSLKGGFLQRWSQHKKSLRDGKGVNEHLQRAWNNYGEQNFEFGRLEEITEKDKTLLAQKENLWVEHFKSNNSEYGYNKRVVCESCAGMIRGEFSQEHKLKLSLAHKGKKLSEETKRKQSISQKGKIKSEEHRKNLSRSLTGKKYGHMKQETKDKIKESKAKNPLVFSEETRKKIGDAHRGKVITQQQREQISLTIKNNGSSRGENNPSAKIDRISAEQIREEYKNNKCSCRGLGKKYGLSAATISRIIRNIIWKNDDPIITL